MRVLEREQRALLPSIVQLSLYYLLNLLAIMLVVTWVVIVGHDLLKVDIGGLYKWLPPRTVGPVVWAGAVLLMLNIPFMLKLWRHTVLRRKLGLEEDLKTYFKAWEQKLSRKLTLALLIIGLVFVGGLSFITFKWVRLAAWGVPFTGVILLTSLLMWRGKQRLNVVQQLLQTLSEEEKNASGSLEEQPRIPTAAWEGIAAIERAQIIEDRERSLKTARHKNEAPEYTVLQSRAFLNSRAELDVETRNRVDDQVFDLMSNPHQDAASGDAATGLSVLRVRDIALEIGYQVDEENRQVKLFYLTQSTVS